MRATSLTVLTDSALPVPTSVSLPACTVGSTPGTVGADGWAGAACVTGAGWGACWAGEAGAVAAVAFVAGTGAVGSGAGFFGWPQVSPHRRSSSFSARATPDHPALASAAMSPTATRRAVADLRELSQVFTSVTIAEAARSAQRQPGREGRAAAAGRPAGGCRHSLGG